MVAPVYAVMRFAAGWSGGLQRLGGRGSGREVNEVELEQRLDQVIQVMLLAKLNLDCVLLLDGTREEKLFEMLSALFPSMVFE